MKESTFKTINKVGALVAGALSGGTTLCVGAMIEGSAEEKYRKAHPPRYIGRPGLFGKVKWYDTTTNKRAKIKPDQYKLGYNVTSGQMSDDKGLYYEIVDHGFDQTQQMIKTGTKAAAIAVGAATTKVTEDMLNKSEWYKSFSDSKERTADPEAVDKSDEDSEEDLREWAKSL